MVKVSQLGLMCLENFFYDGMYNRICFSDQCLLVFFIEEMTLEEYQKVLEEKRKALEALKTEERKVEVDKELASMQPLSSKKSNDEIFAKLVTIAYII